MYLLVKHAVGLVPECVQTSIITITSSDYYWFYC